MTTLKKSEKLPTTTVHQARLRLFQPTRRPKFILDGPKIETAWGWIRVRNYRLGQGHADVLEGIFFHASRHKLVQKGEEVQLQIEVDPYCLRKIVGCGEQGGGKQLERILLDLKSATLQIHTNNMNGFESDDYRSIIANMRKTTKLHLDPLDPDGPGRAWWTIAFDSAFTLLVEKDIKRFYDPMPIAKLNSGISQAVARWILTHSSEPNGGWVLDNVLEAVAGDLNSTTIRHRRRELRLDAPRLAELGVTLDGDRIRVEKHAN